MAPMSQRDEFICLIFYAVTLLVTLATFTATFINNHLFPLDIDNLSWSNAWLLNFAISYYGACLCFCGVVVASERVWWTTILWVLACLVVGTPACCLYIFLWVTKEGGTLRLERGPWSVENLSAASVTNTKIDAIIRPSSNGTGQKRVHFDNPSPPHRSSSSSSTAKTERTRTTQTKSAMTSPSRSQKQQRRDRDLERAVIS